jgi:simple sugar transport system permease protein
MNTVVGRIFKFVLTTKLFWGLAVLYSTGVILSPVNNKGVNIFLSPGNQADVLRQVSNNGIIAVGMTLVILTGGIDLSVGSMMALGSVICAMLLTQQGWTNASLFSIPLVALMCVMLSLYVIPLVAMNMPGAARRGTEKPPTKIVAAGAVVGIILAALAVAWTIGQLDSKFGVLGVLFVVPTVGFALGALNGIIIAKGRLQPFIVTLAMMVAILGLARLLAGQDAAVYPVYTGSNATEDFDVLRALVFNVVPVPGIFFLFAVLLFGFVLKVSTFGRYVYAIGGNEQAARLAGIQVDHVKIAVFAISGMLAALAGVLYTAQYRQGKPDAGTNLMGGRGSMMGTLVGVLIFGFLGNILLLKNIDSNTQLVLKGLIILGAVLLQEGQMAGWLRRFRPRVEKLPGKKPAVEAVGTQR